MREPLNLDVRMEVDDFALEDLAEEINRVKVEQNIEVSAVVMREVQYLHVAREAMEGFDPIGPDKGLAIATIFGVKILRKEDGLTPRERAVQRMLRDEFPPTREEQVAEALAADEWATALEAARLARIERDKYRVDPRAFVDGVAGL